MSVRIRVSYTDDQELAGITRLLSPLVKKWKRQPSNGKYKRAYGVSETAAPKQIRKQGGSGIEQRGNSGK
ncbi:hypothetical protein [Mediterraneibacter agrestimuris]|uniref:hypothetical protein n=1 Tax=Mediterraneibacter agrestimuris TaxID=2941333 RepID=UPI00203BBBF9|nr:hypothetical protein [Mediterraneibacter agrestimuris]